MISPLVHSSGVLDTAPDAPFFFFGDLDLFLGLPLLPLPGEPERDLPRVDMAGLFVLVSETDGSDTKNKS